MESNHNLTKSRLVLLCVCVSVAFIVWGICDSLLPPFYPNEAKLKGASISQSGFVFGIYSLAGMVSSPIFGKYGSKISPRYIYIPGALVLALCTLVFGTLQLVESLSLFLCFSYTLRILSGSVNAATWGALMAALMTIFPDKVSKVVAASEFFSCGGFVLGPAIGAYFYNLGGFILPFEICGSISIVISIILLLVIPPISASSANNGRESQFGTMKLLKLPGVLLPLLDTFLTSFGLCLIDATIGIYLQSMGASLNVVSIAFSISSATYMISTVVVGCIGDKISNPTLLSLTGYIGLIITLLIIGPLPFIPVEPSTTMTLIALGLYGFFDCFVFVSSFTRAELSATQNGFEENTRTYQLISGLWMTFNSMGNFLGPSVGGIVVDVLGFRNAIMILWFPFILMLIFNIIELRNLNREYQSIG